MKCHHCGTERNLWRWGSIFLCGPCNDGLVDWIADHKDPRHYWQVAAA